MPPKKNSYKKRKAQVIDDSLQYLVIVESPAKAKTIKKYLWPWYEVAASMWHIRDLPKKDAIDVQNKFAVKYEISPDKKSIVTGLKKAAKKMKVIIATDEDREWEAIGRHLCKSLWLEVKETPRIVFHEITKDAIQYAITHPRRIDESLVDAQQARRVLDRLVWFELSPVLRKKVKTWLSAGRVQSVAVRLLVEREREIRDHKSTSSYKTKAIFLNTENDNLQAELKETFTTKKEVEWFLSACGTSKFHVANLKQSPWTKNPGAPFTTSSLQQTASSMMWYNVSRTMQLAQRLYEAWYITYMRTDSVSMSSSAMWLAKKTIIQRWWSEFSRPKKYIWRNKWAQEAHECIRPTDFNNERAGADEDQQKLYHLIWQRAISSQMSPAKVLKSEIHIWGTDITQLFICKWEVVTFQWFLVAASKKAEDVLLPEVSVWDALSRFEIVSTEVSSKWPPRYTEASLVRKLEELGIWRPSTYAPTIQTIQNRGYAEKWLHEWIATDFNVARLSQPSNIGRSILKKNTWWNRGKIVPTDVWIVVNDFLVEHFPDILEYKFTAEVESQFDKIASGSYVWSDMLKDFYFPFHKTVEQVTETAERASWERILWKDPETGKTVLVRVGRYGPLVQLGDQWDEDVTYASLPAWLHLETVTLEDAMTGFDMPRILWDWNEKPLKANIWRFGPYIQRWSTFASVKTPDDVYDIEYNRALELVQEKIAKDIENTAHTRDVYGKDLIVKKWRRWYYMSYYKKKKVRVPKEMNVEDVTMEYAIKALDIKEPKKKKRVTNKKTPAKKKTTTKKKITTRKKVAAKK